MKTIRAGEKIYRARITDNDIPLTEEEMGKPPRNKATGGRANPVGILTYTFLMMPRHPYMNLGLV